jgi:hypothetical protein
MTIWYIFSGFGAFCVHLIHFELIWYIFSGFGIIYQEKSGNTGMDLGGLHRHPIVTATVS